MTCHRVRDQDEGADAQREPIHNRNIRRVPARAKGCGRNCDRSEPFLLPGKGSESFRQPDIDEAPGGVIGVARIPDAITTFAKRVRRVAVKNVVAAQSYDRATKKKVPGGRAVVGCLAFSRSVGAAILAFSDVVGGFRIPGHRMTFDWKEGSEIVGQLSVEDESLFDV